MAALMRWWWRRSRAFPRAISIGNLPTARAWRFGSFRRWPPQTLREEGCGGAHRSTRRDGGDLGLFVDRDEDRPQAFASLRLRRAARGHGSGAALRVGEMA